MFVNTIEYQARDQASLTGDYIRLKMTLMKNGVAQTNEEVFDGQSDTMNKRAWLLSHLRGQPVDADTLKVEAYDLELPNHVLVVDGREIVIPLTGQLQTRIYTFPL